MGRIMTRILSTLSFLILLAGASSAQSGGSTDVYWRINPDVESCSMMLDPSLTQGQWHTFIRQVGAISSFKSLSPAATLGAMRFLVSVDYASTPVDQHDPAWINTFVHPDEDCPLGDAVAFPSIRASVGLTDNMDLGGYWTSAPGANYGMAGLEYKFAFLQESETSPAAAVRASTTVLTGVPDFDVNIFSIDLLASKTFARFSPYLGIRSTMAVGTETTSKVDLEREAISLTQGYAGLRYSVWMVNLAAEYNVSSVNSFAFAVGMLF